MSTMSYHETLTPILGQLTGELIFPVSWMGSQKKRHLPCSRSGTLLPAGAAPAAESLSIKRMH